MIRMTDNGNSIKFTFEDCPQYLYNGVIEVPKNSLTMVIDESGMVTFRKSASNDIFLSCFYSELGMSKNEVEAWYQEHGVKDTPSAEEVEDMIEDATQDYFDGAEYDSNSKRINFKHGDTIKGYIDASDFVIDGMVDDVKIENGYLVITFNTESGKQPISIPLTDIFNPNNYYDKTATDALLATKADTATTYSKTEVDAALSGKQDTLIAGENITISGNVISAEGGGGKAISAGTNISITTGETADTINCTVPYYELDNNKYNYSIFGDTHPDSLNKTSDASFAYFIGRSNKINGDSGSRSYQNNTVIGKSNTINAHVTDYFKGDNVVIGNQNNLSGTNLSSSYVFGESNSGYTSNTLLTGWYNQAYNKFESVFGKYNNSVSASTAFGDSGNTLFSVGNGASNSARHNAFEIRQNGDIYVTKDGQDVKLQDQLGGGNNVVTLTQAEYDALVDKDPTAFYIISDAEEIDVDNYYTKSETSGATQISTALSGKQDTLIAGSGITISGNVISAEGGGGSSYTAGRGISIANNTISFNLPISAGTRTDSIIEGSNTTANGEYSHAEGFHTTASGDYGSHAEGYGTNATNHASHAEGNHTTASGYYSHAEGFGTTASGDYGSHAEGNNTNATNESEHASGRYNVSTKASDTFGDSGNTLFSVGNGADNARHNAFEIRQNGDIYCSDGTNDVKLQDTIAATAANTTALGGLSLVTLTQAQYDALATKDNSILYIIVN